MFRMRANILLRKNEPKRTVCKKLIWCLYNKDWTKDKLEFVSECMQIMYCGTRYNIQKIPGIGMDQVVLSPCYEL